MSYCLCLGGMHIGRPSSSVRTLPSAPGEVPAAPWSPASPIDRGQLLLAAAPRSLTAAHVRRCMVAAACSVNQSVTKSLLYSQLSKRLPTELRIECKLK